MARHNQAHSSAPLSRRTRAGKAPTALAAAATALSSALLTTAFAARAAAAATAGGEQSLLSACGPVALPLLLLCLAVLTVGFERLHFWWCWWGRGRKPWRALQEQLQQCGDPEQRGLLLRRQDAAMAWGEPILQAGVVLAPLLGLVGTTAGLMAVLRQLGPQLLLQPSSPLSGYAAVLVPTLAGLQLALLATLLLLLNQGLRRWQLQRLELQEPLPSLSSR
jgi:biopolymer transport protein ExbB